MFAGTFAPRGWALCDGQLLAVSQNDALFSLFGTIYGGDGETTFGLPDLRGRLAIHAGSGPGLSTRRLGQKGGQENVTLTTNNLPSHSHTVRASGDIANQSTPSSGRVTGQTDTTDLYRAADPITTIGMGTNATTNIGGSRSHTNLMPALCVNFICALFGIYPSEN